MRNWIIAAAGAASASFAFPASAEVFWSNFDVTNAPQTAVQNLLPLEYTSPAQTFDNGVVELGNACANFFCNPLYSYTASFEFTVDRSFTASNAIVAVQWLGGYGDQRIGFYFEHFDEANQQWQSFGGDSGFFQLNSSNTPVGTVVEAEIPFGTNYTGGFGGFSYRPLTFQAGDLYRVGASHWAGGVGRVDWMLSDRASDAANRGGSFPAALGYQPTLAFTDGGELVGPVVAGIPEPATWAMLVLGFGMTGGALRQRRRAVRAWA